MSRPLPLRSKLLYASASFGGEALTQSRSLWLLYFYTEATDLLTPFAVGAVLTVARLVESLDDGLVGYWSDRTRSRLGRRIPFILAATPFWALFAFLLFTPPSSSGAAAAAYLFLVLELYYLAATLSGGPYEALLPEIARRSEERVQITGMKVYFGAAGAALGLVGSGLLKDAFGFPAMAATVAIVALTFRYLGLVGVWRRARASRDPAAIGLREALRATVGNRAFLAFLPAFALFQLGFQVIVGMLPFLVDAVLRSARSGTWVAALSAAAIGSMVATIPLAWLLSRRSSKRHAYRASMVGAILAFPVVAVAGFLPGIPPAAQLVAAAVLVGCPVAGNFLFPAPLLSDVVDDDSLRTGLRREATYFGAQNFVEKTTSALAPLVVGALLELGRTSDDPLGIRLAGPVAAGLVLLGLLAFRRYDLPDDVLGAAKLVERASAPRVRQPGR
ncbi:MAG: MFS transporter [Thermoleophilia bacterium]|nr:MFS transporter [Gaiellaceae bacterium]MDW8338266.1 MFS transporter [Thermoleophilia bacterium]